MGVQVWLITSRQTDPELSYIYYLPVVDVGVEYFVEETDGGAFVGVVLGQVQIHDPNSCLIGCVFGA